MGIRRLRCALAVITAVLLVAAPAYAEPTGTVDPPKAEPVLILRSFKTTPSSLVIGRRFRLEITLENAVDVTADNVVVTIGAPVGSIGTTTTGGGPEVVVLGSNTRFIGSIAGETSNHSLTFDLVSNPKGLPGPYSLPIKIEFDSRNGGRLSSSQGAGLMFTRTMVFDVGALTYPRSATVGKPFNCFVSVKNTNDFPISGISLAFDAPSVDWISKETSVGVLEPGKSAELTATGLPTTSGSISVRMVIGYEDDYNAVKHIERTFNVEVVPKPVEQPKPKRTAGQQVVLFIKALMGLGG